MKVKELIRELKKMPQDLEVRTAQHDNYIWEVAGSTDTVHHIIASDHDDDVANCCDKDSKYMHKNRFSEEWVVIR